MSIMYEEKNLFFVYKIKYLSICTKHRAIHAENITFLRMRGMDMGYGEIRFLAEGEKPLLPGWTRFLPQKWQMRYLLQKCPYQLERQGENLLGILQTERAGAMAADWRRAALRMLAEMEQNGAEILVPPAEGELPLGNLPYADGRRLAAVFAFAGAAEALRRQGKEPAASAYLICGGEEGLWRRLFAGMGQEVNRLAILTQEPQKAERLAAEIYAAQGLALEIFSSPRHPALAAADAVLSCGMEQRAYLYSLKKHCFWLELAGNRPMLRRILQSRPDIAAAEGFFFHLDEKQLEGRFAEAEAFLRCAPFRADWTREEPPAQGLFAALQEEGFSISGFSAFGKRVKLRKAP